MSRDTLADILLEVATVLAEVERLDEASRKHTELLQQQAAEQRQWVKALAAWEANPAGEKPRRPSIQSPTVVDYGDVWERLSRLAPRYRKMLKQCKNGIVVL